MRDVASGKFDLSFRDLVPPGEEPAVANLVVAAGRTLATRVGRVPKLYAYSSTDSDSAQLRAQKHERQMEDRLDVMGFPSLLPQAAFWLVLHGMLPMCLRWDDNLQQAVIDIRDPLSTYPSTVWPHAPRVDDALFILRMKPWQVAALYPDVGRYFDKKDVSEVVIAEFHLPSGIHLFAVEPEGIQLSEPIPSLNNKCNVWIPRTFSPDMDFHGQFDQVVPLLVAQAKLMALVMAHAERQVFSETYVIGEIDSNGGDWAMGPNAVNVVRPAPSAAVGTKMNNSSPQVFQDLDRLERGMRAAGGFPAQLSGEPGVSYATGRGIEQLTATVDDNVGHYQSLLTVALRGILNELPKLEAAHLGHYPKDFSADVTIYPKFQAGADPAASVRLLQLEGAKILSKTSIRDQTPEVESPEQEEVLIEKEALREALIGNLLSQAGQGTADAALIAHLISERENGVTLEDAYKDYMKKQQQAAPAAQPGGTSPPNGAPPLESMLQMATQGNQGQGSASGMVRGQQAIR